MENGGNNPVGMDAPSPYVYLPPLPLLLPEMAEALKKQGKVNVATPKSEAEHLYELYKRTAEKVAEYDESSKKSHNLKMRDVVLGFMSYIPSVSTVRRDGEERSVDSRTLVPGDVVILKAGGSAGAAVDADMRIISCSSDCTVFTHPVVPKDAEYRPAKRSAGSKSGGAFAAENMLWSGTFVVTGSAVAVVVATGDFTAGARVDAWCEGMKLGGDALSAKGMQKEEGRVASGSDKLHSLNLVQEFEKTIDVHTISDRDILLRVDTPLDNGLSTNEHDRRVEEVRENNRTKIPNIAGEAAGGKCAKCAIM